MAAIVFGPWRPCVCVWHAGTTIPRSHRKLAAFTLIFGTLYKHTHPEMALDRFDYVVVGGRTAGLVVTARLVDVSALLRPARMLPTNWIRRCPVCA
jgi:hypothetical protein